MNPHIFSKPPSRKGLFIFSLILAVLAAGLVFLNLSCSTAPQPVGGLGGASQGGADSEFSRADYDDEDEGDDRYDRNRRSRPRKILRSVRRYNCKGASDSDDTCADDDDCLAICDDIFSKSKDRAKCEGLKPEVVEDFENILAIMDDGEDFESIDYENLDCFLKISDKKFSKAAGDLKKTEAKDFLLAIAENEGLAEVLGNRDNTYKILKSLLKEADKSAYGNHPLKALGVSIDGDSLIDLVAVENENEDAWYYIKNYISEECETGDYCKPRYRANDGDAKELVVFCRIYHGEGPTDIKELVDSQFFEDAYGDFVGDLSICGIAEHCHNVNASGGYNNNDRAYTIKTVEETKKRGPLEQCTLDDASHFIASASLIPKADRTCAGGGPNDQTNTKGRWIGSVCRYLVRATCYTGTGGDCDP